ncbi:MAG: pentapeptide repeat-containing protein [Terriglobales bacterium]
MSGGNLIGAFYQGANLTRANMSGAIGARPSATVATNQPGRVMGGGYGSQVLHQLLA